MVELKNVSFKYIQEDDYTIKNIDFKADEGKVICLLGKSGSGKTTITRMINKLIPDLFQGELEGDYYFEGCKSNELFIGDMVGLVGSVFQDPRTQFFTTDVLSELAFSCENIALHKDTIVDRMNQVVELLEIDDLLDRDVFSLSSGEKQLIAIASVYTLLPKIIVFDEPSSNLDAKALNRFMTILGKLKRENTTIIIAEHRYHYLKEITDEVYIMNNGHILHKYKNENLHLLTNHMLNTNGLRSCDLLDICIHKRNEYKNDIILEVDNISFSYHNKPIFHDCSFHILKGEIVALIGENGIGKSTLLEIICGLKKIKKGSVLINKKRKKYKERQRLSYFVSQDSEYQLFAESVEKELMLGMKDNEENTKLAKSILKKLNLYDLKHKHPAILSGGQKQGLAIGISLMQRKQVTCLDEPTSGLDYENMLRIAEVLKSEMKDRVTIVSTHDYEFVTSACTSILYVNKENKVNKMNVNNNNKKKILDIMHLER